MKNIILGITGGIAAYKMVEVASRLTKQDNNVHVVMTESATKFVNPVTFQAITHNPVETDLFTPPEHYNVKHVSLADKADLVLVGPATANIIAKMANGIADDLLSTILLAVKVPILVAPSMNVNMFNNPIVQDNLAYLDKKGLTIIAPGSGPLACGYTGKGRLPEPEILVEHIIKHLTVKDLQGLKILVTAGPTREPLDPVRFITNHSSGKMGYALAKEAAFRGAEVVLVTGPTDLTPPIGVKIIEIETAIEMRQEIVALASKQDIIIMSAAVSDFRPEEYSSEKIKKNSVDKEGKRFKELLLKSNPDILKELGSTKNNSQLLIGFAAETEHLLENASKKLKDKNLDMIIANNITKPGIGFKSDDNQVIVINKNTREKLPLMSKKKLASELWNKIIKLVE